MAAGDTAPSVGERMRRTISALAALLALGCAGCFLFQQGNPSILPGRSWLGSAVAGPNAVYIDVAVLQVPFGDRYANEEIWTAADEQILPPAQRATLEENGLRVGLINGRTPDHLLELLTSKRSNPNATHYRRQTGVPLEVELVDQMPACEFSLQSGGESRPIRFELANGQIQVSPAIDSDGKVHLTFTPQIEYRDRDKWSRLNPTIAFSQQGQRSTESYPALGWDLAIAANEYVIVGARFEKPKSMGFQFFVTPDQDRPQQRLLAIRAGRFSNTGTDDVATAPSKDSTAASQAARQ